MIISLMNVPDFSHEEQFGGQVLLFSVLREVDLSDGDIPEYCSRNQLPFPSIPRQFHDRGMKNRYNQTSDDIQKLCCTADPFLSGKYRS